MCRIVNFWATDLLYVWTESAKVNAGKTHGAQVNFALISVFFKAMSKVKFIIYSNVMTSSS